jgi:acyl carrier protein
MMADPAGEGVFDEVVDVVARISAINKRSLTPTTELYDDLGLAGDDLYEVISNIRARFGTDFSKMHLPKFAPGETDAIFSLDPLRKILGQPRRFQSLTIYSLVKAVQAGRWDGV